MLKQLTDNPSARSENRGWELMQQLCTSMAPSEQLVEYVRDKLKAMGAAADGGPMADFSENCLKALDSFNELTVLKGYLMKKSPAKFRLSSWDKRFFVVRAMHVLWWKTEKDAM